GKTESGALIAVVLAGIYTALPLRLGGAGYVPFVLLLAASGWLLVFHWKLLTTRDVAFVLGGAVVLILNVLFSGFFSLVDQVKALMQIGAGLVLAVYLPHLGRALGPSGLRKALAIAAGTVVTLALLERIGLIRGLSDAWREFAYQGVFTKAYDNNARDLAMVGFIRPKAFTAEPAFLAGFLFLCFNSLALLVRRLPSALGLLAVALLSFPLVGSPIVALGALTTLVILAIRFRQKIHLFVAIAALAVLAMLVSPAGEKAMAFAGDTIDRFDELAAGKTRQIEDASVRSRVYVPFFVAVPTAFERNPFWGAGIGGKERLSRWVNPGFQIGSGPGAAEQTLGTNALGNMLATLGIVGFLMLAALFAWYWGGAMGAAAWLPLIPVIAFLFTRGAYETQSFWAAVFLLMTARAQQRAVEVSKTAKASEPETSSTTTTYHDRTRYAPLGS
ncbi:MAG: hypothetical protein ACFB21_00145, partial [Opitutales bacterium]